MSSNLKYLEKKYVEAKASSIYYSKVDINKNRYTIELKNIDSKVLRIVKYYRNATSENNGEWYGERVTDIFKQDTTIYDIVNGERSNERTESFVDQATLRKISDLASGLEAKAIQLRSKSKKVLSNIIQVSNEEAARQAQKSGDTATDILKKINFALNPKNLNYEFFSNQFIANIDTKFDTVDDIKNMGYKIITLGPDKKIINGTSYDLSYNLLQSVVFETDTGNKTINYPRVNNEYNSGKKDAVQMISENNDNQFELIGLDDDGYEKYNTNKVAYKNIFQDEFNNDTSLEKLTIEYAYFQTYKDKDEQQFKKIAFLNVVINKDEDMPPTVIQIDKPEFIVSGDNEIKITVRDIDSDNVTLTLTNYTATVNKKTSDGNHFFTFKYNWDGDSEGSDHDMISYIISDGKNNIDNTLILNYNSGTIKFEDVPDTLAVFQGMKIPIKVKFSDQNDKSINATTLSVKKSPTNGNIIYTQTKDSIVDDSKIFYLEYLRSKDGPDSFTIKVNSNNRIIEKEIAITQKNPSDSFIVPVRTYTKEVDTTNKTATITITIQNVKDIFYFDINSGEILSKDQPDSNSIEIKYDKDAKISYYAVNDDNDIFYFSDTLTLSDGGETGGGTASDVAPTLDADDSITLESTKDSSVEFEVTVNDEDNNNSDIEITFDSTLANITSKIETVVKNKRVITYEYKLKADTTLSTSTFNVKATSNGKEVEETINVIFTQPESSFILEDGFYSVEYNLGERDSFQVSDSGTKIKYAGYDDVDKSDGDTTFGGTFTVSVENNLNNSFKSFSITDNDNTGDKLITQDESTPLLKGQEYQFYKGNNWLNTYELLISTDNDSDNAYTKGWVKSTDANDYIIATWTIPTDFDKNKVYFHVKISNGVSSNLNTDGISIYEKVDIKYTYEITTNSTFIVKVTNPRGGDKTLHDITIEEKKATSVVDGDYTSKKDFFVITDKKQARGYSGGDDFYGVPEIFKEFGNYFRNKGVLHYLNDYYKPFKNWSNYEIYKPEENDLNKLKRIEFVPQFSDIALKKKGIEETSPEKIPTFFDEVALNFDGYKKTDTELTLIQKVKNWEFNNITGQLQMVDQIIEWSYDDKSKFFVSSGGRKFSFVKSKDSNEKFVIGERNTLGNFNPRLRISDFDFKFDLEGITVDIIDEFRIVKDSLLAELEEIKNGNKTSFDSILNIDIYKVWLYNNRNTEFSKKLANSHAKGMDFFNTSVDGFIGKDENGVFKYQNEDEYQNYEIRYKVDKGYKTEDGVETSINISLIRRVGGNTSSITYKYYFKATEHPLRNKRPKFNIGDELIVHSDVFKYKNVQVKKYYESRSPLNRFYTTHINNRFEKDGSSRTLTFDSLSGDINYDGGSYDLDSDGYPSGFNPNSSSQLKINYIN